MVVLSVECLDAARIPRMRDSGPGWRRRNVVWRGYSSILRSIGSTWRLRMHSDPPSALLDRVRKLLAKAEAEGVTPPEAEALTAKAAELMARYGIDRARLAAARPETDAPSSRMVDIGNPWGRVKAHLLCGLGSALRCQCIMLTGREGLKIHVFGYAS